MTMTMTMTVKNARKVSEEKKCVVHGRKSKSQSGSEGPNGSHLAESTSDVLQSSLFESKKRDKSTFGPPWREIQVSSFAEVCPEGGRGTCSDARRCGCGPSRGGLEVGPRSPKVKCGNSFQPTLFETFLDES